MGQVMGHTDQNRFIRGFQVQLTPGGFGPAVQLYCGTTDCTGWPDQRSGVCKRTRQHAPDEKWIGGQPEAGNPQPLL